MGYDRLNPAIEPYLSQSITGLSVQRLHWWRYALTATQAEAPGATTVHAAITMTAAAQTVTTGITNPLAPRGLSVTGGHADCVGVVTITGTNINNDVITESITQNGTATVAGTKAFKTITSLAIPIRSSANTPTVTIGTTDVMGLPLCLPAAACVYATYHNATLEGTAATVTVSSTAIESNTADPNSANAADHTLIFLGYIYT
jgi:hypothetical protein